MATADRFDWPIQDIGTWYNTNPYLNKYRFGYHTGDDWLKAGNADYGAPILACANGVVVFAGHIARKDGKQSTWGTVIVIRHTLPDDSRAWSRYAHVISDKVMVKVGDEVQLGQTIAFVGDADGYYGLSGAHLHFDIAIANDVERNPGHWPGLNYNEVKRAYVNPITFIKEHLVEEPPMAEPGTKLLKVKTGGGKLNMRLTPGGAVVAAIADGTQVRAFGDFAPSGVNTWQKIEVVDSRAVGWAAIAYLAPVGETTTNPPKPAATTGSKIGLHVLPNTDTNAVLNLLKDMHNANKPVAGVTLFKPNRIAVQAIKAASPSTKVLLRRWQGPDYSTDWNAGDLYSEGRQYATQYLSQLDADDRRADYHQLINEPGNGTGTPSWWMGAMDAAKAFGVKLAIGCFAMGNPADLKFWKRSDVVVMLRYAKANGHVMMLHQYADLTNRSWTEPFTAQRHKMVYDILPEDLQTLPLVLGEFGDERCVEKGLPRFLNNIKAADDAMRGDQVLFASLWTLGYTSDEWKPDQIEPFLPALKDYLMAV